jgi:hypothetical protein
MSVITGRIALAPGRELPYKVVFNCETAVLSEQLVASVAAGEALLREVLPKLHHISQARTGPDRNVPQPIAGFSLKAFDAA